jgi:hypothetical protein
MSGFPFSPALYVTSTLNSWMGLRPNKIGDPSVPNPNRTLWFNPGAYAGPALYQFGDASRNSLTAPGVFTANWSLAKNFKVKEKVNLQFRWEVYNAFNWTNLASPYAGVDVPSLAGQIFDVAQPMRNMQFGLRMDW